jgi:hypothetical protein
MKKTLKVFAATILVFGLLSFSLGQVFAAGSSLPVLSDPMASPSMAGANVTTEMVIPPDLPGTEIISGMIMPVGFSGEEQFSGNGLMLSNLKEGVTATVCFDFRYQKYDWRGSVYMWSGTKWMKMATVVTEPGPDGGTTWACASGAGNGLYTLIMGSFATPVHTRLDVPPPSID